MDPHRCVKRCMLGRRWKRMLLFGISGLIAVFTFCHAFIHMMYASESCSNEESQHLLKWLCLAYKQGFINGTLCADLCSTHQMNFVKCLNMKGGKVILLMTWGLTKIVLKTKEVDVPYTKTLSFVLGLPKGQDPQKNSYPDWEKFRSMVIEELKATISYTGNEEQNRNVLKTLWTIEPEGYQHISQNPELSKIAAMDSIWSLVQQTEFTFMKMNQDWHFMPTILGTCGQFYAMEFVDTSPLLDRSLIVTHPAPWLQRVDVAMQLLKLVREMDSSIFPEHLHMCDVKLENFGISRTGQLKAIDVDMFFQERRMAEEIMSVKNCSSHYDCHFFDCRGWCSAQTRDCLQKRINNNLQSVCEKIFVSMLQNGYSGLLQNPPSSIATDLARVLGECSHPINSPSSGVPGKAEEDVMKTLISLLKNTLDEQSSLYL